MCVRVTMFELKLAHIRKMTLKKLSRYKHWRTARSSFPIVISYSNFSRAFGLTAVFSFCTQSPLLSNVGRHLRKATLLCQYSARKKQSTSIISKVWFITASSVNCHFWNSFCHTHCTGSVFLSLGCSSFFSCCYELCRSLKFTFLG